MSEKEYIFVGNAQLKTRDYIKQLEKENREKDKEIERLNNIIKDIETYIHLWNIEEIGEKTMLILNDILLIKNGMRNEVVRLKENK